MCPAMRSFLMPFLLLLAAIPVAYAQTRPTHPAAPLHQAAPAKPEAKKSEGPKALGKYDDWIGATHAEGGQTVCYAFTRPTASTPPVSGRGDAVLTVTERATGRDAVALSAGFAYAPNAAVTLEIDKNKLDFYTSQRSAFARDGRAVVAVLDKGRQAIAHSPGPHGKEVTDTFSLRGFSAAYAAINKACPAK